MGRRITEIYRSDGKVNKGHYLANMIRVRYTPDSQPDDHFIQFALHNFIPSAQSGLSGDALNLTIQDRSFTISPVGNYDQQSSQLLRHGGNVRTAWIKAKLIDDSGQLRTRKADVAAVVDGMIEAISLAVGTLVTSPQRITFDGMGNRNDVEYYSSEAKPFSSFIPTQGWDTPVN